MPKGIHRLFPSHIAGTFGAAAPKLRKPGFLTVTRVRVSGLQRPKDPDRPGQPWAAAGKARSVPARCTRDARPGPRARPRWAGRGRATPAGGPGPVGCATKVEGMAPLRAETGPNLPPTVGKDNGGDGSPKSRNRSEYTADCGQGQWRGRALRQSPSRLGGRHRGASPRRRRGAAAGGKARPALHCTVPSQWRGSRLASRLAGSRGGRSGDGTAGAEAHPRTRAAAPGGAAQRRWAGPGHSRAGPFRAAAVHACLDDFPSHDFPSHGHLSGLGRPGSPGLAR